MTATDALKTNLAAHIVAQMTERPAHLAGTTPSDSTSIPIYLSGTAEEILLPLFGITDTGAEIHEAGDTLMRGVYDIDLDVEVATVPDEKTSAEHSVLARDIWNIIASDLTQHLTGPNGLTLFDFRADPGIIETDDGRRTTRFKCFAVACIET
jgi:hypothetical protein